MKELISKIHDEKMGLIRSQVEDSKINYKITIVSVDNDPASEVYLRNKKLKLEAVGISCEHIKLDSTKSSNDVLHRLADSARNPIFFQLPLPKGWVAPDLPAVVDVDAFGSESFGLQMQGKSKILPCTVQAVFDITTAYFENESMAGKNVAVLGRSEIVGKPLVVSLINKQATVTCFNSKSNLGAVDWSSFDVVVVATGSHGVVSSSWFKKGQLVIDVGINRINGKLKGDVAFDSEAIADITPVPNGVGRLTVVNLLNNIISIG